MSEKLSIPVGGLERRMYLMVSSANVRAVALFPRVGSASAEGKAKERTAMDMKRILIYLIDLLGNDRKFVY